MPSNPSDSTHHSDPKGSGPAEQTPTAGLSFRLLHYHPRHRRRQLRWIVPLAACMLIAVLTTLAVQYHVSDQAVGTEFFRAHKTISHTGELLQRGLVLGALALVVIVAALTAGALRITHRIVRPVHTIHCALEALSAGDLGVRVALEHQDEFHEVGETLNRLVDEFSTTLGTVHALVDRLAARTAKEPSVDAEVRALIAELDQALEFFRLEPRHTLDEGDG